ncbi:MAG: signal peptidase I [Sphingomonas sp.]|uniref:signal peptidase I n=1 Tax=Sphingomonas sp. TaxID=28214 RepID=UPI0025F20441|nr:signal peptidase I [Sphingomonas sp.]MBX3564793.1 signal peptidase I [Sphingomonas sp.]
MSERRGWVARLGLALLNLIVPGLGLLRIGAKRTGLAVIGVAFAAIAGLTVWTAFAPRFDIALFVGIAIALAVSVSAMLTAVVLTLIRSRERTPPTGLSRWPIIIGILLAAVVIGAISPTPTDYFHPYYLPSESMAPLLDKGDRIMVGTRDRKPGRGAVIAYDLSGVARVARVAGLPGDTVALKDGVVSINDLPIVQLGAGQRRTEQFPGEPAPHTILDTGIGSGDNFPAVRIPAEHLFLLGDNRDNAADSRFSRDSFGAGMVPLRDVIGTVQFMYWSRNSAKWPRAIEDVQAQTVRAK